MEDGENTLCFQWSSSGEWVLSGGPTWEYLASAPNAGSGLQLPAGADPGRQQAMAPVIGFLSPMCEIWIVFWAPSFGPGLLWLMQAFVGLSQGMEVLFLYLCHSCK